MIILKTSEEIQKMKKSGELLAKVHKEIAKIIKPGISTMEIDKFVEDYLKEHNAYPEQRGYHGYPYAICASINDEICHGYPRTEPLKEGDIVTIDMVVNIDGWLADSAWSYAVGNISDEARRLLDITKEALYKGIEKATIGNRLGDIGYAIQSFAESNGYSVVRDFVGTYRMKIDDNEWTARTVDGKLSAQYEHTIAITKEGPMILTDQDQCN